jgi:hypothetical protein
MDAVLSVVNAWKDLIIKVFGQYPLAAALITLVAVAAFFYIEKTLRPRQAPTNILIVLLGWAVAVPILGGLLWLLGELWDLVKAVAPAVASALSSLFLIYQKHPFLVLSLVGIAILAYVAWKRWQPNILPSRSLRVLSLGIAVTLLAHVVSPIVEYLLPEATVASKTPEAEARAPAAAASETGPVQESKPNALSATGVAADPGLLASKLSLTASSASLPAPARSASLAP